MALCEHFFFLSSANTYLETSHPMFSPWLLMSHFLLTPAEMSHDCRSPVRLGAIGFTSINIAEDVNKPVANFSSSEVGQRDKGTLIMEKCEIINHHQTPHRQILRSPFPVAHSSDSQTANLIASWPWVNVLALLKLDSYIKFNEYKTKRSSLLLETGILLSDDITDNTSTAVPKPRFYFNSYLKPSHARNVYHFTTISSKATWRILTISSVHLTHPTNQEQWAVSVPHPGSSQGSQGSCSWAHSSGDESGNKQGATSSHPNLLLVQGFKPSVPKLLSSTAAVLQLVRPQTTILRSPAKKEI